MKAILIYCGANAGNKPVYREKAEALSEELVKRKIKMIYGGGSVGLMGVLADKFLEKGGEITGVIPNFLDDLEVGHKEVEDMQKVGSMHERKALMEKLCDGIITLPGGFGSMDEVLEILTWAQLGLHKKPIGLLNVNGYYDFLLKQLDVMVEEGFLKAQNRNLLIVSDDIDELLEKMENYQPVHHDKWLNREQV
ncbi:MAG: hypothetical protein ACI964_001004 [Spirosomataceae bacterium]|jgi:uncharacterized protein (TIGR00730 family)